ncbi:MAG: PIG-L deacetylase family protein [Deinococcales bacterium]
MATILGIYAHPDDEAFGTGGIYSKYAAEGHQVYLICATRGENGKITDPDIDPQTPIGPLREGELKAACLAMGIHEPIFLDYHDSGRFERSQHHNPKALMHADIFALEQDLLKHIEQLKPDVILTFDPHGIYGHIDHIIIHRAATAAFWSAGNVLADKAPKRLFYNVMPTERMRVFQQMRPNSPLSNLNVDLYGASEASIAIRIDVSAYLEQKLAAVRSHRSQVGPQSSFAQVNNTDWQRMFTEETLSLGGLRGSFPTMPTDDLLAAIT